MSETEPRRTVITLHGILTRGKWQKEFTPLLNKAEFDTTPMDYGFFHAVQLPFKFIRTRHINWFRDEYTKACKECNGLPSIAAHSFGTYLVARAMEKYEQIKFNRIILCGSIVRRDFPWAEIRQRGQYNEVLNDCGGSDWVVKNASKLVDDAGPSGVSGFVGSPPNVINRLNSEFSHSDTHYELNFKEVWVPFLRTGQVPKLVQMPPSKTPWFWRIARWLVLIGVVIAATIAARNHWFPTKPHDEITFVQFDTKYEAMRQGSQIADLRADFLGKTILWDVVIEDTLPDKEKPAYLVLPIFAKGSERLYHNLLGPVARYRTIFEPSAFDKALRTGDQIRLSGEIELIGPSFVILNSCKIIKVLYVKPQPTGADAMR